jgi:hypothetical protein
MGTEGFVCELGYLRLEISDGGVLFGQQGKGLLLKLVLNGIKCRFARKGRRCYEGCHDDCEVHSHMSPFPER